MRAIVLKKSPTNDHDLLISCYTQEQGKLTAVAKSALKPTSTQAMQLDLPNLIDFELVTGRAWPIITGAQTERAFPNIKNSLPSLATAYFFLEVFDRAIFDAQYDERLWDFLTGLLIELDASAPSLAFFRKKQLELLQVLGYGDAPDEAVLAGLVPFHSALDARFEMLSGFRFSSLPFLYSVLT